MDLADVARSGATSCPTCGGTTTPRRRPGSSATSASAPVGVGRQAGWHEYPPSHPPRWEDADPHTWDAKLRLERMDEYGVWAQVLYPNVALFNSALLQEARRPRA